MSIILDNREHGLIQHFLDTAPKQLPVGDIWITHPETNEPVVVIERKTTADFEASFLDGRYREQRTRLLAFCAEKKARPLYILEGGLDGRIRAIQRPALQKLIHRLMLRYNVAVWSTKDLADTAATAEMLAAQLRDDPKVFEAETISYTDVQHITKKANKEDPRAFALAALQGCPGISAKAAAAIWDALGSWAALIAAEEKTLADIKVGERRLGPAVAKRLSGLLKPAVAAAT